MTGLLAVLNGTGTAPLFPVPMPNTAGVAGSHAIGKAHGAVLERLNVGVIVVDADGRPVFVNSHAARILACEDGLATDNTGVKAGSSAETRVLRAAILASVTSLAPDALPQAPTVQSTTALPTRLYLERPSGLAPLVVTIVRLDGMADTDSRELRCAALFVVDPAAPVRIDTHGLGATYGLTPREASVTAMLSRGADITQAAETLGICVSSARQYLKRALDKTGTRRQANLVRLVLQTFTDVHTSVHEETRQCPSR